MVNAFLIFVLDNEKPWSCAGQGFSFLLLLRIYFFTCARNSLQGLKAGMLWAGITKVVFLEMLRAVFSARFFRIKLPKPRRKTCICLPVADDD